MKKRRRYAVGGRQRSFSAFCLLAFFLVIAGGCERKPAVVLAGGKPIDQWLKSLSDPDAKQRKQAAEKLGNAGAIDPAIVPALCQALHDKNADVRLQAVIALAKMGPAGQEAAEPLKLLAHEDGDARVREYAAKALEKLETAKQVP